MKVTFTESLAKLLPTSMLSPAHVAAKAARLCSGDSGLVGPEDVEDWLEAVVFASVSVSFRAYG
eukprot:4440510-Heterocapsa_arctica.AAC.1